MSLIRCPNCRFEGRARRSDTSGSVLVLLVLFLISLVFWPMFVVTLLALLCIGLGRKQLNCPRCGWNYPIPVK